MGDQMGAVVVADADGDGEAEILVSAAGVLYALGPVDAPDLRLRPEDVRFERRGAETWVSATVRNHGSDAGAVRLGVVTEGDDRRLSVARLPAGDGHTFTAMVRAGGWVELTATTPGSDPAETRRRVPD